jgi:hypothetical protein
VVVRVAVPDVEAWERAFAAIEAPNGRGYRRCAAGAGECVLETRMGTVELGVKRAVGGD